MTGWRNSMVAYLPVSRDGQPGWLELDYEPNGFDEHPCGDVRAARAIGILRSGHEQARSYGYETLA